MKKNKYGKIIAAAMLPSLFLGGCGLLPAEDAGGRIVLVQSKDSVSYELAQATIDNVELSQIVYCAYAQLEEENLSFGISGRQVQYVYVRAGDTVQKGDLLAKLYTDDLDNNLSDLRYSIEKNELQLRQTKETMEYELKVLKKEYNNGYMNAEQYKERKKQIEESYQGSIQSYEDTLYIAGLKLEKYEKEKAGSEIYAGMDGTVSYVYSDLQGSWASEGREVITVINSSKCAFRTEDTKYAAYFKPGERINLVSAGGQEYPTVVMSDEEAPDSEHVYLALEEMDFGLKVGARATATLVLESREKVLSVPVNVLHRAGEQYYVYCQDEGGLKKIRNITVGLIGTKLVEVLDGLTEGEIVIKK